MQYVGGTIGYKRSSAAYRHLVFTMLLVAGVRGSLLHNLWHSQNTVTAVLEGFIFLVVWDDETTAL